MLRIILSIFSFYLILFSEGFPQDKKRISIRQTGIGFNSYIKFDPSQNRLYLIGNNSLFMNFDYRKNRINISTDYLEVIYDLNPEIRTDHPYELNFLMPGVKIILRSLNDGNS